MPLPSTYCYKICKPHCNHHSGRNSHAIGPSESARRTEAESTERPVVTTCGGLPRFTTWAQTVLYGGRITAVSYDGLRQCIPKSFQAKTTYCNFAVAATTSLALAAFELFALSLQEVKASNAVRQTSETQKVTLPVFLIHPPCALVILLHLCLSNSLKQIKRN
ncbi:hypothetical protein OR1_02225 [Geobacter sp. OR-1]|nr:hypothetical protein OR1_02225 [Geobacter sp. OR-1]